jgi:hypothetical protein
MPSRWWFKEQRELGSKSWTWRVLTVDGLIEQTSREFRDYGAAMHDAIVNGLRPDTDHWIIESEHHTTHFEQGKRPVNVPNVERTTPPSLRPLKPSPSRSEGLAAVPRKVREEQ